MAEGPDWGRDGRDWPNRAASRFVSGGGLRWHVQIMGSGPTLLLVHGTAGATHSWRDLMPALARDFTVVAPDLPGHGFTQAAPLHRLSLAGMGQALDGLLRSLALPPALAVGHSAGAAILARMALDRQLAPAALVSLNGALLPPPGVAGQIFSPIARLLVLNPLVPRLFAWRAGADRASVERLVAGTGSRLDARGTELYVRLLRSPGHAAAALGMMARWDLAPLARDFPRLAVPLTLVAAERDRFIPVSTSERVHVLVPGSRLVRLPGLGHLAHEEAPDVVAGLIGEAYAGTAPPSPRPSPASGRGGSLPLPLGEGRGEGPASP